MESLSARRRRPLKPATIYGWQHRLDRWILPNLADELLLNVGNGALRQFVEILSAAGLAPKTIVNVVTVVKLVVASAVDEEGDQLHPRVWKHEFIQLPLVIKEKQNRPTITETEISALLKNVNERYAVLVALVAGTGLRIGEALALRTEDFDPDCHVLYVKRSIWHRCEQAPKTPNAIRLVDVSESLAQVLCHYIKGRNGHLFTTRAGRLLDSRNVLDVLQRADSQEFRNLRFFSGVDLGAALSRPGRIEHNFPMTGNGAVLDLCRGFPDGGASAPSGRGIKSRHLEVGKNARSEELRPPVSAGMTCGALKICGLHL
jgi:integrase